MRDRYVKSIEIKKIKDIDANNLYGWGVRPFLPCDKIKYDKKKLWSSEATLLALQPNYKKIVKYYQ